MSKSNRVTYSGSSSAKPTQSARIGAQTTVDAKLHVKFEESVELFDYSASIVNADGDVLPSTVNAYLQSMQRGSLIQPFGCMITVNQRNFQIIAYSENVPEMLDLAPHAVPSMDQQEAVAIGMDARTFFRSSSAAALQKAANFSEISLLNPIFVNCKSSGKPFYAILHRIDVGLVIDLEPVHPSEVPVTAAGALRSYKLAAKAISRLQTVPSGNINLLCDVLVHEVRHLTGYDRVMVYKFHEDEHGEVIAENKRMGLEPYIGLHYPATDIPQVSRFLFLKNKVRMICDCNAKPVKVIQDERLEKLLSLCGSTLRSPHGCHAQYMANMGSIASLVMSVTINENEEEIVNGQKQKGRKLWGLVVCHHRSPSFVPFPLRYACEFLIQVFSVQLNKEVELAAQLREKHILRTQSVLCEMLLRDAPAGIVTQSPNIMDLIKCDGAGVYYGKQFWSVGIAPTEAQVADIIEWLVECHDSSTGLSTDSLFEAGYPGAAALGDSVCGMAAVKVTTRDFLFWFRSNSAKEIKWGGAKHNPVDKDDSKKMHPRSSFSSFLEVVKHRSLPWEDVEMDAIHSLQLILRGSFQEIVESDANLVMSSQITTRRVDEIDELMMVTNEMVRLIETATVPILAVDNLGQINGWNSKAVDLTGLLVEQALGLPLVDIVLEDSVEVVKNMLLLALEGKEEKDVEIKLKTFGQVEKTGPLVLVVNACASRDLDKAVVGVCFVAQDITEQKMIMDKFTRIQGDYASVVQNPSHLIPPLFIMDELGYCSEWNSAMNKLSGLGREDAIHKLLIGEVFGLEKIPCRVKDVDTLIKLKILINTIMEEGHDSGQLLFGFFGVNGEYVEALLFASKRTGRDGKITGVLCFLHIASPELQNALQVQRISEQAAMNRLKELAYVRQEIRNPLNGIMFTTKTMEDSHLSMEQKQYVRASALCQDQLAKVLDDMDLESIEECYLELKEVEFNLGESLEAVICQGMLKSKERHVQLVQNWNSEVSSMWLHGDNLRLRQVLAEFLLNSLQFTSSEGLVLLQVVSRKEQIGAGMHVVHLEFRIVHSAPGIPEALIQEMYHQGEGMSKEGLGLYVSQKLVRMMNGTVQYLREADKSSFILILDFHIAKHKDGQQ